MRRPTQKARPAKSQFISFPAPTGGLVSNRNLAMARGPDVEPGAAVMDDWFPTATGIVLRRGSELLASVVDGSSVDSVFSYVSGSQRNLFAAVSTGVRDITTVSSADTFSGPDVLTGQTSGDWNVVQFSTAGGEFLVGVNGADSAFAYDGATFSSASITFPSGSTLTTADLAYVWVYKQRLYFIEKDSLNAWYLPVDQIGGELTLLPLGGVFVRGGTLIWGQAWSLDSGGSGGLSEQCVFTTTEGEVAAYQGLSPDVDQGWSKVGVYRIGRPLGDKAFMRAGGDIVIATTVGFISLASASRQDYAALGQNAVSYPIEDDWADAVRQRGQDNWRCEVWPDGQMALISPPQVAGSVPVVFVVNVNTGKWCRFRNWPVASIANFNGRLFFGAIDGTVKEAWVGGTDEGMPYFGQVLPLFEDLGAPGSLKIVKMARAVVRSSFDVDAQLSAHANFIANFPAPTGTPEVVGDGEWGVATWGESTWNSTRNSLVEGDWVPLGITGHDVSVGLQITSGDTVASDAELVRIDMTYTVARVGT